MSQQPDGDALIHLPIGDTLYALSRVGEKWESPKAVGLESERTIDNYFHDWIIFCILAYNGEVSKDPELSELEANIAFHKAMGAEENYPKIITQVESAFAMLLSLEGREQLERQIPATKIDAKLREKVMKLVTNMEQVTDEHDEVIERSWRNIEDEDDQFP